MDIILCPYRHTQKAHPHDQQKSDFLCPHNTPGKNIAFKYIGTYNSHDHQQDIFGIFTQDPIGNIENTDQYRFDRFHSFTTIFLSRASLIPSNGTLSVSKNR